MKFVPDKMYHFYNRGNDKVKIFYNRENYFYFLRMEDWEFSSFQDYCGFGKNTLCNEELAVKLLDLPDDKDKFYKLSYAMIDKEKLKKIF